ncbi:A/G-specific adenine glycosylase [Marinospirillum perlucidum]|uniref:A/G-specific adenine glycosylase n=1 Tax=Marinospirillum perlucidum TaxID=1982602 RepID=UPI001FEB7571|nr:A/G-specific adenine glycosylase [Marinospirillum perlucidum]
MKATAPMTFAQQLLNWFEKHGRKSLPWQQNPTPYRVWVSEIMLQQTQVTTVKDYYQRFMQRFPELENLAEAPEDEVLGLWAGLGYYTRARNLHACARCVASEFDGQFPTQDPEAMRSLPGIGPSTAHAIIALSSNQRAVILDGNVKRVLARYFAVQGWPGKSAINRQLWQYADEVTPPNRAADYTQAIMDLGATLCTPRNPQCNRCPVAEGCLALSLDLTDQLPTPKPKKQLPQKERHFLLLHNQDREVLLYKRPSEGLWGGLWSLPEFPDSQALKNWLQAACPPARLIQDPLPGLRHSFSHYHLQLIPWVAYLDQAPQIHEEAATYTPSLATTATLWYNPEQNPDLGLATPIKRLLQGFQQ